MLLQKLISKYFFLAVSGFMLLFYGIHFLYFHGGYFGFDDIEYCRLANSLNQHEFSHDSLYAHRYMSFVPLAIIYKILGVSDLSNFLPGLICLALILYLIFKATLDCNVYSRFAGFIFFIFAPMHLMYAEKPMPDIWVELGFFICFLSYYSVKFQKSLFLYPSLWFMIGGSILFLSKETVLIFYPYFLVMMLTDLKNKRNLIFWKQTILYISLFSILYLSYSYLVLGDALARVHHIFEGQYISACSYEKLPFSATFQRVLHQLWTELIRNLYFLPLVFLPYGIKSKDTETIFLTVSFVGLLLLSNFMTISYTSYIPLCPDPRHVMYVLPIGSLVIIKTYKNIEMGAATALFISMCLSFILLMINVWKGFEITWWFYLLLMASIYLSFRKFNKTAMTTLTVAFLSVYFLNSRYNDSINYKGQKLLNEYVINKIPEFKYAVTDRVNHDYGLLHSNFDKSKVQFVEYLAVDPFRFQLGVPIYLIANGMTSYLSNTLWDKLPTFVQTAHEKLLKVYENKSGTVYKVE